MTVAVYAAPPPPPPVVVRRFPGVRHTWTDWTGRVWDLSDPAGGAFLTDAGLRGIHMPPQQTYLDEAAGVDGQAYRGHRILARDCFWPIFLYEDRSTTAWLEHDAAWWRGLQPGRYGTWTITTPDGSRRHLRVRGTDDGQGQMSLDPSARGWEVYGVKLVADDPYWTGDPIHDGAGGIEPTPFIDPDGSPPLHISGGLALAGMSLLNPGDVPAWPVWTATGPHTDLVVGVDEQVIECPDVPAGATLVIDTSPWVRTALLDGVDVTAALGQAEFRPVPATGQVRLTATTTGGGSLRCEIRPRYYRAW